MESSIKKQEAIDNLKQSIAKTTDPDIKRKLQNKLDSLTNNKIVKK